MNQCDGCAKGDPISEGIHVDDDGLAYMVCQKGRYEPGPLLESDDINDKTVKRYRQKLLGYLREVKPDGLEYSNKTYLLDMLYFMGLAVDEEKYRCAGGFEKFKKKLMEAMR